MSPGSCSSEVKIQNAEGEFVLISKYVLMVPLLSLKQNICYLVPYTRWLEQWRNKNMNKATKLPLLYFVNNIEMKINVL